MKSKYWSRSISYSNRRLVGSAKDNYRDGRKTPQFSPLSGQPGPNSSKKAKKREVKM